MILDQAAIDRMKSQITADIDKDIFRVLENTVFYCHNTEHAGYAGLVSSCSHPDCVVRSVMDE
jgi:hypothetical protein